MRPPAAIHPDRGRTTVDQPTRSSPKIAAKNFSEIFLALKYRTLCVCAVLHYPVWVPYRPRISTLKSRFPIRDFGTPIEVELSDPWPRCWIPDLRSGAG
jgi:hypothetical protein